MTELKQTLEEAGETFQQKETEMTKMKEELSSVIAESEKLSDKHSELVADHKMLTDKMASMENQLSSQRVHNSETEQETAELKTENSKLNSEVANLKTQLAGRKDSPFLFKGKENTTSALSKARALGLGPKSASTISLSSQSSGHRDPTPVRSTQGTPYLAMHTKSSLLRLQVTQNSPAKVEKCLDHSCFANNDNRPNTRRVTRSGKRKSAAGLEADTRATKKRKADTKPKKRVSNVFKRVYATRSRVKKSE